jgi:hypothetical protein
MKFNVAKEHQIIGLLAEGNSGLDGWSSRYLGIPSSEKRNFEMHDVFDITERDVLEYVKVHGWDRRIVHRLAALPEFEQGKPSSYEYSYVILPPEDQQHTVAYLGNTERATRWSEWSFPTEDEASLFIIRRLFETQRTFWGGQQSSLRDWTRYPGWKAG